MLSAVLHLAVLAAIGMSLATRPAAGGNDAPAVLPINVELIAATPQRSAIVDQAAPSERPAPAASESQAQAPGGRPAHPMLAATAGAQPPADAAPTAAPAAAGAVASLSASADPALDEDYRRRLLAHIAEYRRAPELGAGERASGTVLLQLALDRQGDVLSVAITASSGVNDLDDAAVATIWRARPMPPIPADLPGRLAVILPVRFDPARPAEAARGD